MLHVIIGTFEYPAFIIKRFNKIAVILYCDPFTDPAADKFFPFKRFPSLYGIRRSDDLTRNVEGTPVFLS